MTTPIQRSFDTRKTLLDISFAPATPSLLPSTACVFISNTRGRAHTLSSASSTLFVDLLEDWDRNCSVSPDLDRPFIEMRPYSDEHEQTRWDSDKWLRDYERHTDAKRALCSDPMPKGALFLLLSHYQRVNKDIARVGVGL